MDDLAVSEPTSPYDDDYATVAVPDEGRSHWSIPLFALSGIGTALFYQQIGSIVTLQFGTRVALIAIAYASVVGALAGGSIASLAIRTGYGTNLLARSLLGFRGSALFSLVMGLTGLTYFVAEATIMGAAVHAAVPTLSINIILGSIAFLLVPLLWFGMIALARIQAVTLLFYAVLLAIAIVITPKVSMSGWLDFEPPSSVSFGTRLIAAAAIMNGVVFITALVVADFARFVHRAERETGTLFLGILFPILCFAGAGLLGMYFALVFRETNPGVYFVRILGIWGTFFAIATQLRINVSNMYLGSLAMANTLFQSFGIVVRQRATTVTFAIIATALFLSHSVAYLTATLTAIGLFMANFVILILMDAAFIRRQVPSASPQEQREWRSAPLSCLVGSTLAGLLLMSGIAGPTMQSLAVLVAGLINVLSFSVSRALMRPCPEMASRSGSLLKDHD